AVDPPHAGLDHEAQLQAPVQGGLREEEPGLRRPVREVLQVEAAPEARRPRTPRLLPPTVVGTSDMAAAAATLEVRGLSKAFGSVQALHAVDFSVRAGEVMALVG